MNWYEQKTNEYRTNVGRQLLNSDGKTAWYGAYIIVKQVISENMNEDMAEWGYVPHEESMESLAEKTGLPIDEFRLFLSFCDQRFIFEQRQGRLFCQAVLEERSQYAKKIERKKSGKSVEAKQSELSELSRKDGNSRNSDLDDVTTQHITTQTQHKHINKILPVADAPGIPQKPKKQPVPTELQRVVKYLGEVTGAIPANFGKQAQAWSAMQKAGYSEVSIRLAIDVMWEDDYWKDKGFDLTNVMNNIAKIKQRLQGAK